MAKKKKETQVAFLLDQTGSMYSCKSDTIGGFNQFLKDQKKDKSDTLKFSLTLFNSAKIEKRYVDVDIQDVSELSDKNYIPNHLTPLWDAIGKTLQSLSESKDVLFVILTDGYENYSKEFKSADVKKLIKEKEKKAGWKFLFLGADLSKFDDALTAGINFNFKVDKSQMRGAFANVSQTSSGYRSTGSVAYAGQDYSSKDDD